MCFGIHFSGMAYIASLDVTDNLKVKLIGFGDEIVIGFDALPEIFFKESDIYFHRRYHRGNYSHSLDAEVEDGVHGGSGVEFVIHRFVTFYRLRQTVINGVKAYN